MRVKLAVEGMRAGNHQGSLWRATLMNYLRTWNGGSPFSPIFRFLGREQKVLIDTGSRCQWYGWWSSESDAPTDKLLEGPAFHHTTYQTELEVIT